jgi:hypothetical protein
MLINRSGFKRSFTLETNKSSDFKGSKSDKPCFESNEGENSVPSAAVAATEQIATGFKYNLIEILPKVCDMSGVSDDGVQNKKGK